MMTLRDKIDHDLIRREPDAFDRAAWIKTIFENMRSRAIRAARGVQAREVVELSAELRGATSVMYLVAYGGRVPQHLVS